MRGDTQVEATARAVWHLEHDDVERALGELAGCAARDAEFAALTDPFVAEARRHARLRQLVTIAALEIDKL